jgi:hypothetical protein
LCCFRVGCFPLWVTKWKPCSNGSIFSWEIEQRFGLVFALRPQTSKHIRGGWSHYTDTSEPVDGGVQLWTTRTILSVKMDRENSLTLLWPEWGSNPIPSDPQSASNRLCPSVWTEVPDRLYWYSKPCEIRTPLGRAECIPNLEVSSLQGAILHWENRDQMRCPYFTELPVAGKIA